MGIEREFPQLFQMGMERKFPPLEIQALQRVAGNHTTATGVMDFALRWPIVTPKTWVHIAGMIARADFKTAARSAADELERLSAAGALDDEGGGSYGLLEILGVFALLEGEEQLHGWVSALCDEFDSSPEARRRLILDMCFGFLRAPDDDDESPPRSMSQLPVGSFASWPKRQLRSWKPQPPQTTLQLVHRGTEIWAPSISVP